MSKAYAVRITDREVLKHSSSGGAFTALSDVFLKRGDAVLCAGYNYDTHQSEFRLILNQDERDSCRGSMYMQSFALNSWRKTLDWMMNHPEKQLIFFGVGCQGAAFRQYCETLKFRDRVTIVDIICHGVPSPMIWKDYALSLERKKDGRLSEINMRDKRNGWSQSIGVARLKGEEISISKWRRAYSSRTMSRPCCAFCPYTTTERETDVTIGDFWGIEKIMPDFFDKMGTSLLLIHTEKGMALFDAVRENVEFRESNTKDCLQMNLQHPTSHARSRRKFWHDYYARGIDYVMDKYGTISFAIRIKRRFKRLMKWK